MNDPRHRSVPARAHVSSAHSRRRPVGVTVERVDLASRWARMRFVRAGEQLDRQRGFRVGPSFVAETYRLDPHNSPALACTEAIGLLARVEGRLVGRMVALRPSGGGEEGWFSRLEVQGGAPVLSALAAEGARWVARGGGVRWSGPVGLMPGDVCGVQVDGFVGRRAGDLPRWPRDISESLSTSGFTAARETGFWLLPITSGKTTRTTRCRLETADLDLADVDTCADIDWNDLLARLPASTDPVSRLTCAPDRLRHELLRNAIHGGVTYASVGGTVAALGVLRPACSAVPGVQLPAWLTRLRQWKRRATAGEGQARIWTIADHHTDPIVAAAVLDRLVRRARTLGYRRLLVGPVATEADGVITALRDRGARIDCRFNVFAQRIDRG